MHTHLCAHTPMSHTHHTRVTHIHVHTPVSHPHLCANVPVTPITHPCLTHISHTCVHTHLCHSPHLSHTHTRVTHNHVTLIPHPCVHTHLCHTHTRVTHTPVSHTPVLHTHTRVSHTHHTHVTHSYPTPVYTHTCVTHHAHVIHTPVSHTPRLARGHNSQQCLAAQKLGGGWGGLERSLDPLDTPFQSSGQAATRSQRKVSLAPAKSLGCSCRRPGGAGPAGRPSAAHLAGAPRAPAPCIYPGCSWPPRRPAAGSRHTPLSATGGTGEVRQRGVTPPRPHPARPVPSPSQL